MWKFFSFCSFSCSVMFLSPSLFLSGVKNGRIFLQTRKQCIVFRNLFFWVPILRIEMTVVHIIRTIDVLVSSRKHFVWVAFFDPVHV